MSPEQKKAIDLVIAERCRQDDKWGDQSGSTAFEWMSILGEEYGELCMAVNDMFFGGKNHLGIQAGNESIKNEAVQVAAVTLAIVELLLRGDKGAP